MKQSESQERGQTTIHTGNVERWRLLCSCDYGAVSGYRHSSSRRFLKCAAFRVKPLIPTVLVCVTCVGIRHKWRPTF